MSKQETGEQAPDAIIDARVEECVQMIRHLTDVANENDISPQALIDTYNAARLAESFEGVAYELAQQSEPIIESVISGGAAAR